MKIAAGVRSDTGRVREGNEDSFLARTPLFALADGMGGHVGGEVASRIAIGIIEEEPFSALDGDDDSLKQLVRRANQAIHERAGADRALEGMGTTCTLLMLDGYQAHLAHVGDSRAYLLRDGHLEQVTQDHTLVQRMVQEGRLSPEEAVNHPHGNIITRVLGVEPDVEVDIVVIDLQNDDRILLCSDGLTDMITPEDIKRILVDEPEPQEAADHLVDAANEAGGQDNITAMVVRVTEGEDDEPGPQNQAAVRRAPPPPPPDGGNTGEFQSVDDDPVIPDSRSRGRWFAKALATVAILAILGAAGYAGARYLLSRSFFVGVDDAGTITVFRGIPEEVAGITLKEIELDSNLAWERLPTRSLKENVREGIKVDSFDEAEQTVDNLKERIQAFEQEQPATEKQGGSQTDKGNA
ncbi:MAG: Stp1/IreP family PP2C-type Ser/Thr phosphatase [Actinomycetota bacterium]|nr:Stp1/IreP family PP2C-type Ser/Thr phosphatase [Actinomycetota bacterium]